jgi:transposase-like protein
MRLARNKDEVLKAGVSSVVAGRDMIRGFERSRSIWSQRNDHVRKEALALVSAGGKTHAEVAELVGVSTGVLRSWLYPETARRADAKYRDIKRNRRELQKIKDREESARRAGVSDAYSQIRKLANSLDGIYRTGANPEIRAAAGSALKHVHKAEDEFIKALRSLRQTIDAEAVRNARS